MAGSALSAKSVAVPAFVSTESGALSVQSVAVPAFASTEGFAVSVQSVAVPAFASTEEKKKLEEKRLLRTGGILHRVVLHRSIYSVKSPRVTVRLLSDCCDPSAGQVIAPCTPLARLQALIWVAAGADSALIGCQGSASGLLRYCTRRASHLCSVCLLDGVTD